MLMALEKYGTMSRERLMAPAIRLAEQGFTLTRAQAERFNANYSAFAAYAGSRKYFTKGDSAKKFRAGEQFVQSDLAEVLKRIRDQGREGFYSGRTAELIAEEMERGGGIITKEDLASYRAKEREPIIGRYRGRRVISMPPPSSGGIAVVQLLNAVEPYDLSEMGFHSSATIHLMGEAMRRVYADRAKWLGDSDFFPVPREGLLGKEYMRQRMSTFNPYRADTSSTIAHGTPPGAESTETTHYSVVDGEGNAVSVTTTINAGFGSKVVVDGAGFFLNNEMDDFSAKPGVPNMYGLVGGEANAVEPGKRMLSSMSPTIVEDPEGRLLLVIGTPGGSTIITTVFQVITNVIDHGMDIQEAVSVGRVHHQWLPDEILFEPNAFDPELLQKLRDKGYKVREGTGIIIGKVDAILRRPDGKLEGGADRRGDDTAVGF
jgi:gamma-glutamyltranspeptidase/glutathione hydrolase